MPVESLKWRFEIVFYSHMHSLEQRLHRHFLGHAVVRNHNTEWPFPEPLDVRIVILVLFALQTNFETTSQYAVFDLNRLHHVTEIMKIART